MKNFQICDRVASITLSVAVLLGLVAFVPGGFLPFFIIKGYVLVAGVLIAFAAWILGRLLEGSFRIPSSRIFVVLGVLVFFLFISSIFSHTPSLSVFGQQFEEGTFVSFAVFAITLFLAAVLFGQKRRGLVFLSSFSLLYILIALFQIVHVFFPSATALGSFFQSTSTPVGSWSDLAFLSGAVLVGSALVYEFLDRTRLVQFFAIVGTLLSLFLVALADNLGVWIMVGVAAIFILTYKLVTHRKGETRPFPFFAFILSLIALFFILANTLVGGFLADKLSARYTNAYPSFSATIHVARESLWKRPITGAGPNRFQIEWLAHHPASVNQHPLWDVSFSSGSGYLITMASMSGVMGILGILALLGMILYEGVRKVFVAPPKERGGTYAFSMFLFSAYFLATIIFFSPGIAIIVCAFFFVGLFLAALGANGKLPEHSVHFLKDQRASFFTILIIVFLLMLSAGTIYAATERFIALVYFYKSDRDVSAGDLVKADERLSQAIRLADLPVFERSRTALLEALVSQISSESSVSSDSAKDALQQAISAGNGAARQAVALDSYDPVNLISFGDFMRSLVPFKVSGAFDAAHDSYAKAIALAPHYPKSYLDMAALYFANGDSKNARDYIQKAFAEKSNYSDAFFLLSDIETSNGDSNAAFKALENAVAADPQDPNAYFILGRARYQNGDYQGAASSFSLAAQLAPSSASVWFSLALADIKIGKSDEARVILGTLQKQYPNNTDIQNTISDLESGKSIPANTLPSAKDSASPEKTSSSSKTTKP